MDCRKIIDTLIATRLSRFDRVFYKIKLQVEMFHSNYMIDRIFITHTLTKGKYCEIESAINTVGLRFSLKLK